LRRYLLSGEGWPYLLVPFIPLAIVLDVASATATAIFIVSAIGVIPTAALMGKATEELAARSGPGIGGLLTSTFGNAPEIIIAVFALAEGLQEVVKASLVGSILGNTLLVLGAAAFVGGLGRDRQYFNRTGGVGAVRDAAPRHGGTRYAGGLRDVRRPRAARPHGGAHRLRPDGRAPLAGGGDHPHAHRTSPGSSSR
jgi:hypothetical protein